MRSTRRYANTMAILVVLVGAMPVAGQEQSSPLSIVHDAVACVSASRFPQFKAEFIPAGSVSRARVLFRPHGTQAWYAVAMKQGASSAFVGTLPKPRKALAGIDYYIEAIDRTFGTSRTGEFQASVIEGPAACQPGKIMAGSVGSAAVAIEIPTGAPTLPAGFSSAGVTSAASVSTGATVAAAGAGTVGGGGGISATTLAVIGGAVAAGGVTAAVVAAGNSSSAPPSVKPASVTGSWTGTQTYVISAGSYSCPPVVETLTWNLTQSGNAVSGTETYVVTSGAGVCTDGGETPGVGESGSHALMGTSDGSTIMLNVAITSGTCTSNGTVSGNTMNGQLTCGNYSFDPTRRVTGTWSIKHP
jgi:hypothetical protein